MEFMLTIFAGFIFMWLIGHFIDFITGYSRPDAITKNDDDQSNNDFKENTKHTWIMDYFSIVDLYVYYALEDGRKWTSEKVRHIKEALAELLVSELDLSLLQQRLKKTPEHSLDSLINLLKISEVGADMQRLRATILLIGEMLIIDNIAERVIRNKVNYLARKLGISDFALNDVWDILFPPKNQNNHEKTSKNEHKNHSFEWACKVLGLSCDDITPEKVQKAYRSKIKEYHPDKHQNLPEPIQQLLHEKTLEVNEARDLLS